MKREPLSIAMLVFVSVLILLSAISPALVRNREVASAVPLPSSDTLPRGTCVDYIISPYDSIIKVYSDSAGLDWRLVAAVIYHESKFDNDARSHKGAVGLMQMMPETAEWLGAEDITDPIESVRMGTRYLRRLHRAYRGHTEDPDERLKFTLAAYNAGVGRIQDCIRYASMRGVDTSSWDNIATLIPEMNSDEILDLDTLRYGKFNGEETIAYVNNVLDKYAQYRRRAAR